VDKSTVSPKFQQFIR